MSKLNLFEILKAANELIIVFLQFCTIALHFVRWEFIPEKEIIRVNFIFFFIGLLIIVIGSAIMLVAIKDLGDNLSPFPKPKANGNLVTSGIYSFMRHPMYFSLILISFGIFITKLNLYYLFLTITLSLIIKFKIILEDKYLNKKFKDYFFYKQKIKF